MVQDFAEALMGAEVDALCGAAYGERSPERVNRRNGYRERRWDTRVGSIELAGAGVEGIAVHIGARVAALAGPGEVLVSRTVKDLVAGSGLQFLDRGTHELKGVPNMWQIFQAEQMQGRYASPPG